VYSLSSGNHKICPFFLAKRKNCVFDWVLFLPAEREVLLVPVLVALRGEGVGEG